MTQVRSFSRFILLAASLMVAGQPVLVSAADLLVLMNGSGKVERYDLATGAHVGTVISGLPSSNEILFDADRRLLISTGVPGGVGNVLRFDPRRGGKMETWLDVPEGYGGRLVRATGKSWRDPVFVIDPQAHGLKMGTRLDSFWCDPKGRLWLFFAPPQSLSDRRLKPMGLKNPFPYNQ